MRVVLMNAVRTTETSVYSYEITQRNISGGCHLQTREDLKFRTPTSNLKT